MRRSNATTLLLRLALAGAAPICWRPEPGCPAINANCVRAEPGLMKSLFLIAFLTLAAVLTLSAPVFAESDDPDLIFRK
jgi:hypothetical protein